MLPTRRLLHLVNTDPNTTVISTLSLHDALPICVVQQDVQIGARLPGRLDRLAGQVHRAVRKAIEPPGEADRKSTRLNSSHMSISYAVFCLKKKPTPTNKTAINAEASSTLFSSLT